MRRLLGAMLTAIKNIMLAMVAVAVAMAQSDAEGKLKVGSQVAKTTRC